jgi:site-specific DNA recombinase
MKTTKGYRKEARGGKIAGYCRVSTENQKEEGTIAIQRAALKEYAEAKGYELVEVFSDDGVSGGLEHRPGLSTLFEYLEEHPEVAGVLIWKLDRLARDLMIQENLIRDFEKRGKSLISTKEPDLDSGDPTRVFIRQVLGATSQYEKAMITMRMTGGRVNKARKGGYAGGFPAYGYEAAGGDLKVDQEQAETVKTIFRMRRYQHKSFREIARALNEQGTRTARGGKWHASTVQYICSNLLYRGTLEYSNESAKRAELAIV